MSDKMHSPPSLILDHLLLLLLLSEIKFGLLKGHQFSTLFKKTKKRRREGIQLFILTTILPTMVDTEDDQLMETQTLPLFSYFFQLHTPTKWMAVQI